MSVILEPVRQLTPEDFKAQLYAAALNTRDMALLPRTPVAWGQPKIVFLITEDDWFHRIAIFDRMVDGEPLLISPRFISGPRRCKPGDTLVVTVVGHPWN